MGHMNPYVYGQQQQQAGPSGPAPPLPPGPPPPAPAPGHATAGANPYAGYNYAAYTAPQQSAGAGAGGPPQAAAHPQYPGYGYGGQATTPQAAYGGYGHAGQAYSAAQSAQYYGAQAQQPQANPAAYAGYVPPAQQGATGGQPPYAAPQGAPASPYGAAGYSVGQYGHAPAHAGSFAPQPGPSHQGAPPYKRTRYDMMSGGGGPPPPPLPPGPAPPPPALPPVGGRGPPPARGPPRGQDGYGGDAYRGGPPPLPPGPGYAGSPPRERGFGSGNGPRGPRRDGPGYDSRSMPPPPPMGGPDRRPAPPPAYRGSAGGPPHGDRYGSRGGDFRGPGGGRGGRGGRTSHGSGRDTYAGRDSRRDDRARPPPPAGAPSGAPRGPRAAVNRKEPRGRERKWGTKDATKDSAGSKDDSKGTLTDFRISALSIGELDWEWKTEQVPEPPQVEEDDQEDKTTEADSESVADMSVDTINQPGEDAAAPKKLTRRQKKAAAKRKAAAKAAGKEGDAAADSAEVAPEGTTEQAQTSSAKKDGKHGRDDDADDAVDAEVTAAKKVKADTGEAVTVQSGVDAPVEAVKSEQKDEPSVEPKAETEEAELKNELQNASTSEQLATGSKPALSSLSNRENSRLRIYFASPVSGPSTYTIQQQQQREAEKKVASTESESTKTVKEEAEESKAESIEKEARPPAEAATLTTAGSLPAAEEAIEPVAQTVVAEEAEVDGEPVASSQVDGEAVTHEADEDAAVDGEPLSDKQTGNDSDDSEDDAAVESTLLVTTTGAAPSSTEVKATAAPVVETDNATYPPDPYSQGAQPVISREPSVAPSQAATESHAPHPPEPSADRISISYARNTRRIVLDAEVVDKVQIFRQEGRIEVTVNLKPAVTPANVGQSTDDFRVCQGILIEALDPDTDDYFVVDRYSLEHAWQKPGDEQEGDDNDETGDSVIDPLLPPLHHLLREVQTDAEGVSHEGLSFGPGFKRDQLSVVAYLDRANPLTEARWVKTGEVEQWIISLGLMNGQNPKEDTLSQWRGKIVVADPDPPPTIEHALQTWATSSTVGNFDERQKFVATHMSDIDNVVEILLRLTRGDRPGPSYASASSASQANSVGVLAATLSAPYPDSQTQVSLAVLAMFRLSVQTAEKAGLDKAEVHRQVSEIVRGVPYQLQYKALDGMFKEYRSGARK